MSERDHLHPGSVGGVDEATMDECGVATGDSADVGIWEYHLQTVDFLWSSSIYQILEVYPADTIPRLETILERVHVEDRARVEEAFENALHTHDPLATTYRLLMADGRIKHVRMRGEFVRQRMDDAFRFLGSIEDVSRQVQQRNEQVFAHQRVQSILDSMYAFVGLFTPDGVIVEANAAPLRAAGLQREDVLGKVFWETYWWSYDPAVQDQLRQAMARAAAGEPVRYDAEIRVLNDERRIIDLTFGPLLDSNGSVTQIVGSAVDVTDRKQMEQELWQSREKLQTVITNAPIILYTLDLEGRFTLSEGQGLSVLGLRPGQVVGCSALELYGEIPEAVSALKRALNGETFSTVVRSRTLAFQASYRPLVSSDGVFSGVLGVATDITAQCRVEEALIDRESRLREAQGIARLGTWEWRIADKEMTWSPELFKILGHPLRDESELPSLFWDAVVQEDRNRVLHCRKQALEENEDFDLDFRIVRPDGRRLTVHARANVLRDDPETPVCMTGTLQDISSRVMAEEALRKSEELYRSVVAILDEGVVVHHVDGTVSTCNREAERILGVTSPLTLRSPELRFLWDATTEDGGSFSEKTHPFMVANLTGMPVKGVIICVQKSDQSHLSLSVNSHPLFVNEFPGQYAVTSFRDITEQRKSQYMLSQRQAELAHVSRIVTTGEMATQLAHELNQPLGAIGLYIESVQAALKDPDVSQPFIQGLLAKAVQQTQRAGRIIQRLREFVRRREPTRNNCSANMLVDEMCAFVHNELRLSEITLDLNLESPAPIICADPIQIEQVLLNLIRNAIDAMNESQNPQRRLSITTRSTPGFVMMTVADTGNGISEDLLRTLFIPFYSTKQNGLGMGLAISRSILEHHGGTLNVSRNSDGGLTFSALVPEGEHDA